MSIAPTRSTSTSDSSGALVTPARLFALPDASAPVNLVDPDGSRRVIAHGMRLIERVDGSLARSDELFPPGRLVTPVDLPARLGGGYLFHMPMPSSGSVLVWRAKTWTGKLEPFANIERSGIQIVPGFDRLYAISGGRVLALDKDDGHSIDEGPLPRAPLYGAMAFADGWLGAVDVPYRGVLASFDAGRSWHPLGAWAEGVRSESGEVVLATGEGQFALDADGRLRQRGAGGANDTIFSGAGRVAPQPKWREKSEAPSEAPPSTPGPFGKRPLRLAALRGWPDSAKSAVVAAGGALGRVRLSDGKLLASVERAFAEGGACQGVALGNDFGFVCGEERGKTAIYAFERPLGLRAVISFDEPRYVASSGNGALVVRGNCATRAVTGDGYCIVGRDGALREIRVHGDRGVERVVGLRDGRVAVIVPPRLGAPGLLTLVDAAGRAATRKLVLPTSDARGLAMLKKGLWLDGFVESSPGVLSGWVVSNGPFEGVRVKLDGTVEVGKVEAATHDVERALLSGTLAMVLGPSGVAFETVDGGFSYRSVDLPPDLQAASPADGSQERAEQGCTPVGCVFATWMRIGWNPGRGEERLDVVEAPPRTRAPNPGGDTWRLSCAPTGESSPPTRAPVQPPPKPAPSRLSIDRSAVASDEEFAKSEWRPFAEVAPPIRRPGEIGFDTGGEGEPQLRGYVWGARGASWNRAGRWLVRVADRFSLADGVWSTEPTRSPWTEIITAAQAFGADTASTQPQMWRGVLEPSGRAAVLSISARGTHELYLLEPDHAIVRVRDAPQQPVTESWSAVKVGSTWYLGHAQQPQFRVFAIEGDRMRLLSEYPVRLPPPGLVGASLVRSSRGDQIAILVHNVNAFLYPIDRESGSVGDPIEVTAHTLSKLPRPCNSDDDGFEVMERVTPQPNVDFLGVAEAMRVKAPVEARLLVGALGICTEALAAQVDGPMPSRLTRAPMDERDRRPSVGLVLTHRESGGRRWGFRCWG